MAADKIFDAYVMIDWSASATPTTGRDSIWIAHGWWCEDQLDSTLTNPSTRYEALQQLRQILGLAVQQQQRVLLGFDFNFGYPAGFAGQLAEATDGSAWENLLERIHGMVADGENNANNRHQFAAWANQQISNGPGPFWGCHQSQASAWLTSKRVGVFDYPCRGIAAFRHTELAVADRARPSSAFQLLGVGAVGGQTIMGLRALQELRLDPEIGPMLAIWPLTTGWQSPAAVGITVVEIYPSLIPPAVAPERCVDANQVMAMMALAAAIDCRGTMRSTFAAPALPPPCRAQARQEEGWIWGIDAARYGF